MFSFGNRLKYPAGVFKRLDFMITKDSYTIAIKSLQQEKSLQDIMVRLRLFVR